MLKSAIDVTVPAIAFLLMTVVGSGLTGADFRRVARRPWVVALATAFALVVWPAVALAVIAMLRPPDYVAAGILLVAACPAGGMANFYSHLGRANVALAVTLTVVSCLAAVLTMPLLLALFRSQLHDPLSLSAPVPLMVGQLILLLILPTLLGMAVRRARPALAERHGPMLLVFGFVLLAVLVGLVVSLVWERLAGNFMEITLAVALLTVIIILAGWAAGWAGRLTIEDRFTLATVLVVRNVAVATAVAVTVLGRTEFAVFATAYFLTQLPIVLAALGLFRLVRRPVVRTREATGQ
jgi:BASS family bile acid:Na+ symporter